jgi:hypothetical protein
MPLRASALGLLALLTAACPPATPPPTDPADDPATGVPGPPNPDPAPPALPPGQLDAATADPDPAAPDADDDDQAADPPRDPPGPVAPPTAPSGSAGRLLAAADCFPRAVAALQAEPGDGESLEVFLARGLEALRAAGPLPGSCALLRPDGPAVPICPGGERVRVERTEGMRDTYDDGHEELELRYRFDCGGGVTATTELTWSVGGE